MSDDKILRSWKEISNYLKCDRKTCSRWETQYKLPVHRIDPHSTRSRVFAYADELDLWMAERMEKPGFPVPAANPPETSKKRSRVKPVFLAAGILLAAAPVTWVLVRDVFRSAAAPHIALHAFKYPSDDTDCAYLADWLKTDLTRRLTLGGKAEVMILPNEITIPRYSEKSDPSLPDSDFVIQGEVRKTGESIRWDLRLNDAQDGEELWKQSWETGVAGLNPVLSEADLSIRNSLKIGSPPKNSRLAGRSSFIDEQLKGNLLISQSAGEARDLTALYFQGRYFSGLGDPKANEMAIRNFEEIIRTDSSFGLAYLGLARCYVNYINFNWKYNIEWLDKADEMLARAVPFVSLDVEYFRQRIENLLMRDIFSGTDSSAVYFRLAQEGLALYPMNGGLNSIVGYCYFRRFDLEGRESDLDEAVRAKSAAYWAEPGVVGNIVLGQVLMLKKKFDKAINICTQLSMMVESSFVKYQLAEIQYYAGLLDASEAAFRAAGEDLTERTYCQHFLGMIAARKKDRPAALNALHEIELLMPKTGTLAINLIRQASIQAGLGNMPAAEELLGKAFSPNAVRPGNYILRRLIELDRNFDQIRSSITLPYRAR